MVTQAEMSESLARVEAIFMPGRLEDKCEEISRVRASGDSMYFEGEVRWNVFLPEEDKRLRGESESLDCALGDMAACMVFLKENHDGETEVVCAVELSGTGKDQAGDLDHVAG